MFSVLLLAAAPAASAHVIVRAFDVELGKPPGDLTTRGFRRSGATEGAWSKPDDGFFTRIVVRTVPYRGMVESVTAHKVYLAGDLNERREACDADLAAVAATLKAKYPTLRKPTWFKSGETGMGGLRSYYTKRLMEEPVSPVLDPSPARLISLTCVGPALLSNPSPDGQVTLLVAYRVSEAEAVDAEAWYGREAERRDRARARAKGLDPDKL